MLVPPFRLARKELGAVAAIAWQFARAVGGDARAAGQQWGRFLVWASRMPPPLVTAVWRLLLHGSVAFGCALWMSAWLVLVLGQAWVQSRPLCEAVHGDSSAPPSSFDFNSFMKR